MILARILEHKKAELRRKHSRGYLSELKGKILDAPSPWDLLSHLMRPEQRSVLR